MVLFGARPLPAAERGLGWGTAGRLWRHASFLGKQHSQSPHLQNFISLIPHDLPYPTPLESRHHALSWNWSQCSDERNNNHADTCTN